jgi:hypothetical protein
MMMKFNKKIPKEDEIWMKKKHFRNDVIQNMYQLKE